MSTSTLIIGLSCVTISNTISMSSSFTLKSPINSYILKTTPTASSLYKILPPISSTKYSYRPRHRRRTSLCLSIESQPKQYISRPSLKKNAKTCNNESSAYKTSPHILSSSRIRQRQMKLKLGKNSNNGIDMGKDNDDFIEAQNGKSDGRANNPEEQEDFDDDELEEDEDYEYFEYDYDDQGYKYIEWDDDLSAIVTSDSEYEPYENMNDEDLLQFLNLPDDLEVTPSLQSKKSIQASSNPRTSNNEDDLSILEDPNAEDLMALELEQELWMMEEIQNENNDNEKSQNYNMGAVRSSAKISSPLERALLEGVVPAGAGVGSGCLPGDYGFDPLNFATKDYFRAVQRTLLSILPGKDDDSDQNHENTDIIDNDSNANTVRPTALILRDYREAEIRHGRLAMLAAMFWPLQEIMDRIFIPVKSADFTVIYGGVTLPFLSLVMTQILLLLGYLDIYAKAIKEEDTGEAFLPGECFWDPLKILDGASEATKRRMQERELNNGRFAMVAVTFFILEEAIFHKPLISLPFNQFLFEPAFTIPAVQQWLDHQFQGPSTIYPAVNSVDFVDFVDTIQTVLDEGEGNEIAKELNNF